MSTTKQPATEQPDQADAKVEARGFVSPTEGRLPLATIDAPGLGVHQALLLLDGNRLTLLAPCGCSVHADIGAMVHGLAANLANHAPGATGPALH